MALFNSLKRCRSPALLQSTVIVTKQRSLASSSTPRFAAATATATASADGLHHQQHARSSGLIGRLPTYGPMWVVLGIMGGMVAAAGTIGFLTAKQQLFNSPSVQVSKKKRQSIPEVDYPNAVLSSAEKFIDKSFLRKVAHIQDNNDPTRPNPFTRPRNIETLKSAGVGTRT